MRPRRAVCHSCADQQRDVRIPPVAGFWLLALAWSHAVLSLAWLLALTVGLHRLRGLLLRRKVRRGLDATTGAVLLGFGARLTAERA